MDRFERFTVGPFGETEHRPFAVIEPIGDVADPVVFLDSEIELVSLSYLGGGGSWRIVAIKEQGHAVRLVTKAKSCTVDGSDCGRIRLWTDPTVDGSDCGRTMR